MADSEIEVMAAGALIRASQVVLGKTLEHMGDDLARLYTAGRDRIVRAALRRVDPSDGKCANLRVSRDALWHGSFSEDAMCAEYFGGVIVASRSEEGEDDTGVYYVGIIRSLSSAQLRLHYNLYRAFNLYFSSGRGSRPINARVERDLQRAPLFFLFEELNHLTGSDDLGRELYALYATGLIGKFKSDVIVEAGEPGVLSYAQTVPTTLGVQLYAVAHAKLKDWDKFSVIDFGDFESLAAPRYFSDSIDSLAVRTKSLQRDAFHQ